MSSGGLDSTLAAIAIEERLGRLDGAGVMSGTGAAGRPSSTGGACGCGRTGGALTGWAGSISIANRRLGGRDGNALGTGE